MPSGEGEGGRTEEFSHRLALRDAGGTEGEGRNFDRIYRITGIKRESD